MTESSVTYVPAISTDAGAIPVGTPVATHPRASDGKEVQDVFIDPQTVLALPTGAATSSNQTNGNQLVQVVDTTGAPMIQTGASTGVKGLRVYIGPTDPISDIPVYMPYDHHQVHEGETWHWDKLILNLASGANYDIVFTVPVITIPPGEPTVVRMPHFRYEVEVNDLCNVFLFEAPTVTAATGTARTPINFERNGTYTPKLAILDAPTITATGTQIDSEYFIAAATKQSKFATTGGTPHEFVLRNNTKYLLRVTSGANGLDAHVDFTWYEDLGV